jgi:hypothetical protein
MSEFKIHPFRESEERVIVWYKRKTLGLNVRKRYVIIIIIIIIIMAYSARL